MLPDSNKYWFRHALLLICRSSNRSVVQVIPSFTAGYIFFRIYLVASKISHPDYIAVFLVIALVLLGVAVLTVYVRESNLELTAMSYLFLAGFSKTLISLIVYLKWVILITMGTGFAAIALKISELIRPGRPQLSVPELVAGFCLISLFFWILVGLSIIAFVFRTWRIK